MSIQMGDIDDDDDDMIDQEEEISGEAEQRNEAIKRPITEIASRDPIIINR